MQKKKMSKFKVLLLFMCGLLCAAMLSGCQSNSDENQNTQVESNSSAEELTLKIGAASEYKMGSEGKSLILDFPLDIKDDGKVAPGLFREWKVSEDLTEYEIKIVKDVKFHDGTELTPEIVKNSIELWGKLKHANYPDYIESVDVVDAETLKVKFKEAYSIFMNDLAKIYITKPGDVDEKGNFINFNGTGPYKLAEFKNDALVTFERNEDYWNKEKMPSVKHVEWVAIEDPNSRKLALESGEVDVLGISEHYRSIPHQVENELLNAKKYSTVRLDFIDADAFSMNWLNGPLTDQNLRKAITYAIDRKSLTEKLYYGLSIPTGDYLNPKYIDGPINQDTHTYDVDKAKKYLEAAGYEDSDNDGFVDKDGNKLTLRFICRDDKESKDTAVFIQNELKNIGINIEIEAAEKKLCSEMAKNGDFDIVKTHPWKSPLVNHMKWRGLLKGYDDFGAGYNVDPKIEELTRGLMIAKSDEETSRIANEIWRIEYEFVPVFATNSRDRVVFFGDRFTGFKLRENNMMIDLSDVKGK